MFRTIAIWSFFLLCNINLFSQSEEMEMDDSPVIYEDPRNKMPAEEQYYLDRINVYVDYFYDFRVGDQNQYQQIHEKVFHEGQKYSRGKVKLFIYNEKTSVENIEFVKGLLDEKKLHKTTNEAFLIVEFQKGELKKYNFGISPDLK